jgi:hypothetical protein
VSRPIPEADDRGAGILITAGQKSSAATILSEDRTMERISTLITSAINKMRILRLTYPPGVSL